MALTDLRRESVGKPSLLACTGCRSRHLKCDATQPKCSRCASHGLNCNYTASRRGRARGQRGSSTTPRQAGVEPRDPINAQPSAIHGSLSSSHALGFSSPLPSVAQLTPSSIGHLSVQDSSLDTTTLANTASTQQYTPSAPSDDRDGYIGAFWASFYPHHPFLGPRGSDYTKIFPHYLQLVISFVGSHYCDNVSNELRESTLSSLAAAEDSSVSFVHAHLLLAIVSHMRHEVADAGIHLNRAIDKALEIGLNTPDFAANNGQQNHALEESLRRTWWELFITDGFFAALHQQQSFRCNEVQSHALLPSHGFASTATNRRSHRIQDFENRVFSSESRDYSPYCYRIEAVCILGRVLSISGNESSSTGNVQAVENAIARCLQTSNATQTNTGGCKTPDHLMFQARMLLNCARIILHFPRSRLPLALPSTTDIECTRHAVQSSATANHHATLAIRASEQLASMTGYDQDSGSQSPLLICALVLGCVVQLSAYSAHFRLGSPECLEQHRDHIGLMLSSLENLSQFWRVAGHVLRQLRAISSCLFGLGVELDQGTTKSLDVPGAIDFDGDMMGFSWLDVFYQDALYQQPLFNHGTIGV